MLPVVFVCTFALLLLGGGEGQQVVSQCPNGWFSWKQFCYLFVNTSKVTWNQAGNECQDQQAHLLRIETLDEYRFLRKAQDSRLIPLSEMYWTALNNLPQNQGASKNLTYMWGNDAFPLASVVQNHWDKEPDNTDFKDCVVVNTQGYLSMANCNDRKAYICEYTLASGELCSPGWMNGYSGNKCYKVSNATNWQAKLSWEDARKTCENNPNGKTRLIAITTRDVQNFLAEVLPTVYKGRSGFWTALNDRSTEDVFVWAGLKTIPMTVDNFAGMWRQEPNNLGGNEHCGSFLPSGRWNDRNCEDQLNYACRLSLPNAPQKMNFGCGSWTRAGRKCVSVSNTQKTWSDARKFCQSAGGDLLKFSTKTDTDWMTMQSQNSMVARNHPGYWIGLNDRQTENTFLWADGSEALAALLNWDKEPNGYHQCVAMSDGGFYFEMDCHHTHAGSICEDPTKNCAPGWHLYNGHCYKVYTTWKTRDEASDLCRTTSNYAGHLVSVNFQNESTWIKTQLSQQNAAGLPHRFWTGLINSDRVWVWENADNQDANSIKFVNWSQEPNNYNNEDCVEILANGNLNDADCAQTRGFICQKILNLPIMPSNTLAPPAGKMNVPVGKTMAPGRNTMAPGRNTMAPGRNTMAPGRNTMAPGRNTMAPGRNTMAPGRNTMAPGRNTMAPGRKTMAPGGKTMAPGKNIGGNAAPVEVRFSAILTSLLAPVLYKMVF